MKLNINYAQIRIHGCTALRKRSRQGRVVTKEKYTIRSPLESIIRFSGKYFTISPLRIISINDLDVVFTQKIGRKIL